METKYDIDEIIYLPYKVRKIEIESKDFNGVGTIVKYLLVGEGVMENASICLNQKDMIHSYIHPVKTQRDFK